jgi:hypothetical protein
MAAVTIAASLTSPLGLVPFSGTIVAVRYLTTATITGAASPNSRTFTLYNRGGAGAGVLVAASLAMVGGVAITDLIAGNIPVSAVAGASHVNAGDFLDWESLAVTGAGGLVDPGGIVEVEILPDRNGRGNV